MTHTPTAHTPTTQIPAAGPAVQSLAPFDGSTTEPGLQSLSGLAPTALNRRGVSRALLDVLDGPDDQAALRQDLVRNVSRLRGASRAAWSALLCESPAYALLAPDIDELRQAQSRDQAYSMIREEFSRLMGGHGPLAGLSGAQRHLALSAELDQFELRWITPLGSSQLEGSCWSLTAQALRGAGLAELRWGSLRRLESCSLGLYWSCYQQGTTPPEHEDLTWLSAAIRAESALRELRRNSTQRLSARLRLELSRCTQDQLQQLAAAAESTNASDLTHWLITHLNEPATLTRSLNVISSAASSSAQKARSWNTYGLEWTQVDCGYPQAPWEQLCAQWPELSLALSRVTSADRLRLARRPGSPEVVAWAWWSGDELVDSHAQDDCAAALEMCLDLWDESVN